VTGIVQSGNVTPGHLAAFVTDGVIGDGGPPLGQSETVLAQLLAANFNVTTDQTIALPPTITKFCLTRLIVTNPSLSLTTAVGGFYPAPSKGGTSIVANTQVYSGLTAASKLINPTLTSFGTGTAFDATLLTSFSIYFALTTPQGVACTADIFICGIVLAGSA
jgi:hypothetical protein